MDGGRPADLVADDALTTTVPHFAFAARQVAGILGPGAAGGWAAGRALLLRWEAACRARFPRRFDRFAFDLFVADMAGEGASWLFDFAVAIAPRDRATGRVVAFDTNPAERVFASAADRPDDAEIARRIAARRGRGAGPLLDVMMNLPGVQGSGVSAPAQLGAFPVLHVEGGARHAWELTDGFLRNASRLRGEFMRARGLGGGRDPYLDCLVNEGKAASA
jgi:hypothetical protein